MLNTITRLGSAIWSGGKAILGIGAVGGAAEVATRGEDSSIVGLYENVRDGLLTSEKTAGMSAVFAGLYQAVIELANFFGAGPDNFFRNWAEARLNVASGSTVIAGADGETPTPEVDGETPATEAAYRPPGAVPLVQQASADANPGDGLGLAGAATGAVVALKTGARAIPLVASFAAAADGIWDTGSFLLRGEFEKAATRFTSGAAETVLSAGGFLTATLGVAAREGIEEAGAALFGEENRVPDSEIVALTKRGLSFFS